MSEKRKNLVLITLFLAFIFFIAIFYFVLPKEKYSEREKRYLASFPSFSFEELFSGDYTKDIESYLADHTPFRAFFIGLNSYYNYSIMNNGSNDIYLSKDGYLIEKPVSENNSLYSNAEKIQSFSKELPIKSYFLLAPSKGEIMSDKLPLNHLQYKDSEYLQNIENIVGNDMTFINLTADFKAQNKQIYYKTDHHWNMNGAYIAYRNICKSMKIEPIPEDKFNKRAVDNFYGTSYSNSGYWFTEPDTLELWTKDNNITVKITEGSEVTESDTMFFEEHLKTEDKYSVYLDGNHAYEEIVNNDINDGETLLVVKDSYAHCVVPLLSEHFSKIIMVDLRYYKKPLTKIISDENVNSVLYLYSIDNLSTSTDIVLY